MKSIVAGITLTIALTAAPMGPSIAQRIDQGIQPARILFCDILPWYCRNR